MSVHSLCSLREAINFHFRSWNRLRVSLLIRRLYHSLRNRDRYIYNKKKVINRVLRKMMTSLNTTISLAGFFFKVARNALVISTHHLFDGSWLFLNIPRNYIKRILKRVEEHQFCKWIRKSSLWALLKIYFKNESVHNVRSQLTLFW